MGDLAEGTLEAFLLGHDGLVARFLAKTLGPPLQKGRRVAVWTKCTSVSKETLNKGGSHKGGNVRFDEERRADRPHAAREAKQEPPHGSPAAGHGKVTTDERSQARRGEEDTGEGDHLVATLIDGPQVGDRAAVRKCSHQCRNREESLRRDVRSVGHDAGNHQAGEESGGAGKGRQRR